MDSIKHTIIFFFLLCLGFSAQGQKKDYKHQVFLTGNICDAVSDEGFYTSLKTTLKNTQQPFSLILNGDLTNAKYDSQK